MRNFVLLAITLAINVYAQQSGWISRYWDGCKPSCAWSGKNQVSGGICKSCDKSNNSLASIDNNRSSCEGGNAYTCWDMIPFRDPSDANKAYAFAATPSDKCGQCYEIKFNGGFQHGTAYATHKALNGKTLIVMASNMGGDVNQGQFDVLIPGGGLGNYDAFSPQIGVNTSALGAQRGGFLADCETTLQWDRGTLEQYQTCLRNKCNQVFNKPEHAQLKEGCNFYADWFMAANNPTMTYKEITCPQYLIDRYKTGSNTPTPGAISSSSTGTNSSSSGSVVPIRLPQIASGNLRAQATTNAIVLENLPSNTKIEVYSLQGKQIYSNHSENSQILKISVQTKGIYVVKVSNQTLRILVM